MSSSSVLRSRDLRDMLDVVHAAADPAASGGLPYAVLAGLARLIPCDLVSFCDLDLCNGVVLVDQEFPDLPQTVTVDADLDRQWWASFRQNRFCSGPELSGDHVSVTRLSDFYSSLELRGVLGYRKFFRDPDVTHELMVCLPAGPGRARRLLFSRGRGTRDFTERDQSVLSLLRPHLHDAWVQAEHARRGVGGLTPREWQVLELAADGRHNDEIARVLLVSTATVRKHLEHVFDKLGVRSRTAAAALAFSRTHLDDAHGLRRAPVVAVAAQRRPGEALLAR